MAAGQIALIQYPHPQAQKNRPSFSEGAVVRTEKIPESACQALFERSLGSEQSRGQVVSQLLKVGIVQLELIGPGCLVDAGHGSKLLGIEIQPRPVDFGVLRSHTKHGFLACSLAFDAVD